MANRKTRSVNPCIDFKPPAHFEIVFGIERIFHGMERPRRFEDQRQRLGVRPLGVDLCGPWPQRVIGTRGAKSDVVTGRRHIVEICLQPPISDARDIGVFENLIRFELGIFRADMEPVSAKGGRDVAKELVAHQVVPP